MKFPPSLIPLALTTGCLALIASSALSAEPHTPSSRDLEGTESRQASDWNWAVGGEYTRVSAPEPLSSEKLDPYLTKIEKLNSTLEIHDSQLGDVSRPTRRLPLMEF